MSGNTATPNNFSEAKNAFDSSIRDAEVLLEHFSSLDQSISQKAEVFKRAGLVMALTAWETYVEDRIMEGVQKRVSSEPTHPERFMQTKLEEELKRFHNPSADKTRKLFTDYLEVDITTAWTWQHVDPAKAKERLDLLLKTRGDAVHRAKRPQSGPAQPHLVSKEDLGKAIRFLKNLVAKTDEALTK